MRESHDITFMLQEIVRLYGHSQRIIAMTTSHMPRTQSHTIIIVGRFKAVTLNQLSEKLGFEKSWMSRVVDGMVKDGWIVKSANPADRRSVLLSLSPQAEVLYDELLTAIDSHTKRLLDSMPVEEQEQVLTVLSGLLDALYEDYQSQ